MKSFDEHLFTLRLQDACKDLHRDTNARLKQVNGEQRKIGQGYGPGWLAKRMDAAIDVFRNAYVPKVDKACRETWLSDHDTITPEFIRRILVPRVFAFVAARKGAIQGETELLARRTGIGTRLTPALHHLVREIDRVHGELATLYEIEARELAKRGAQVGDVTQAPAPVRSLRGGGITPGPKPTEIPPDYPNYYPNHLKPKTQVVFGEAIRKFTEQTQALELCKHVISELTPAFRESVEAGAIRPEQVQSDAGMGGLIHYLLVHNCDSDNERYRLGQKVRRSDEWLNLAREIADAAQELSVQSEARTSVGRSRLSPTINCASAARRMEEYWESKGVGQTDFASQIGTTDRTLRTFRKTGRIRRDIFDAIAKGMGITKQELLKPE